MPRRQPRANAARTATADAISTASDIPMTRPPPSAKSSTSRQPKTLYEIAAERQAELSPSGQPFPKHADRPEAAATLPRGTKLVTLTADGRVSDTGTDTDVKPSQSRPPADAAALPPLLDTVLLSIPLSSLHFTLTYLTHHQYAQRETISLPNLLQETLLIALPTLTLLIHISHGHLIPAHIRNNNNNTLPTQLHTAAKTAQQILFLLAANIAGCYLIHLTNDRGYFAVMKRAPAIGTVWVWSIIELGLTGALAGVVGPAIFAWWNGYEVI